MKDDTGKHKKRRGGSSSGNGFRIVDENGERGGNSYIKWMAVVLSIAIVVAGSVMAYRAFNNGTDIQEVPEDYELYEEKAKIYQDNDIEYTYDDYKQDELAMEALEDDNGDDDGNDLEEDEGAHVDVESLSDATKQLYGKNDQILQDIKEDTQVDVTALQVAQSITQQTKDFNTFIDNHVGWPDNEYNDEYSEVKQYVDSLVSSMSGGSNPDNIYPNIPIAVQQAEVRYAISEGIQYKVGNNFTQYRQTLNSYMKMGHPILYVDTISLQVVEDVWFDDIHLSTLQAVVSSGGATYKIHLASQVRDDGKAYFKIMDVER